MTEQPVIICGLGEIGWLVFEYVRLIGWPMVAVDDAVQPDDPRLKGVRLVRGDCRRRETLEKAGIAEARGVLILTSNDLVNVAATLTARSLRPNLRVVLRLFNQNLKDGLGRALPGVTALSKSALTAPLLALTALTGDALGTLQLPSGQRQVTELQLEPHSPLCKRKLGDVIKESNVIPLLHRRAADEADNLLSASRMTYLTHGTPEGKPYITTHAVLEERYELETDPEAVLAPGDRLVICGTPDEVAPLEAQAQGVTPEALQWASAVRRWLRLAWRTVKEIDLTVRIAAVVLISVILTSTLTFYFLIPATDRDGKPTGERRKLGRSLFLTISIMATSAEMHERELSEDWHRTFASTMRIIGITLTAAFTAILTRFLLNARFGDLFATRRMPDKGHVVICGLGTVGFRIVEVLRKLNHQVVVVERLADSRFVEAAKRLGALVQIGDGTLEETLRQTRVESARAFIAATSNDLVNIEMALQVRHLHPQLRVVVRLDDPQLADTLRLATRVRYTLALPALAAPAFVATLLYDGELSLFWVEGQLLAALELVVHWYDPLLGGRTVSAVTKEHQLVPIEVIASGKTLPRDQYDHHLLKEGDRLSVVATLSDFERLLRAKRTQAVDAPPRMNEPDPSARPGS
jgi:Trk K+ transport system NAD-binding subunit